MAVKEDLLDLQEGQEEKEEEIQQLPEGTVDTVIFVQNTLRELNNIFETHKEDLVTSNLSKDVIEGISKKITGVAIAYDLIAELKVFDNKDTLAIAALPIYRELSKGYLLKGGGGFTAKILKGIFGIQEEQESKRSWGWFRKEE